MKFFLFFISFFGAVSYLYATNTVQFAFEDILLSQADRQAIEEDVYKVYTLSFADSSWLSHYKTLTVNPPFLGRVSTKFQRTWPLGWYENKRIYYVLPPENQQPALWVSTVDSTWYTNHFTMLNQHTNLYEKMCAFINRMDTEGRAGRLSNREAFDVIGPMRGRSFIEDAPYANVLAGMLENLTFYPSAKAMISLYPPANHPTGKVLVYGRLLTNKPGPKTPNFMGGIVYHNPKHGGAYDILPLLYYNGKWEFFYPDSVIDVEDE